MKTPIYLIPCDFSAVSLSAIRMGIDLAHFNDGAVLLLHFVDKKTGIKDARDRFSEITDKLSDADQARVTTKVLVGNIYDHIAIASELIDANLIVMGTHGAKGLQKLFGSHALKLVSSTNVPFMIMQHESSAKIKTIVMPYYFKKESVQIAQFAAAMAKQFDATIHLVGFHHKDEWLEGNTKANQVVLRRFFTEAGVKHEITNLPGNKTYEQELIQYADQAGADLIAVSYYNDSLLPTMHSFVQHMIENDKQIPVLTVNAEDLMITSGYSFLTI